MHSKTNNNEDRVENRDRREAANKDQNEARKEGIKGDR